MKKSVMVLIFGVMLLSSCAQYTCPTYSKAPVDDKVQDSTEERI